MGVNRVMSNIEKIGEKKKNTFEIHIFDALGFPQARSESFTVKDIVDQYRKDLENHEVNVFASKYSLNIKELTDHQILISILSSVRNTINEHMNQLKSKE